jgi:macrolide transport system ATP-binding/permease protein
MKTLRAWLRRIVGMVPTERREQEFAAEIDSHLQMHIEDNLRAGMSPAEARRRAILTLGGVEVTKQAYREQSTVPLLETFMQDLRFAVRQLRRSPGFTCTAVLILALGMCASVAIFAFVDAALIKPLPYPDPTRLLSVTESVTVFPRANLSYQDYVDWKKMNTVLSSLEVYTGSGYMLSTGTGVELVEGARVSDGFFKTLGVKPVLGRDFYAGEDLPSAPKAVMLTYNTWKKRYGGRKDVIGQAVILSGIPITIVGVLPESFQFAPRGEAEFWATLNTHTSCELRRGCHNLNGIGRLKDGVTVAAASAEMKSIAQQLERQYPDTNRGQGAAVDPLSEVIIGDVRPILLTLLGGAALLLLIACVNVASLLLVRSEGRRREIAVRGALGASPSRLIRQFVTEGVLLVVIASAIGLGAAFGAMQLLMRLLTKDILSRMPYLNGLGMNTRVMVFALCIALLAVLVFSFTPMLRLSKATLRDDLNEGSRGAGGTLWRRLGSNLVVVELAVAMVLLVSAGLLGKSFYRLLHVDIGFQPDHLATFQVVAPELKYGKDPEAVALSRRILSDVSVLPGVKSAALVSMLPISGNGNTNWIRIAGKPYDGRHNEVNERDVSAGYFTTLKATLLQGRYFSEDEDQSKPRVVLINQALARKYFPGENPVGQHMGDTSLSPKSMVEIVGVVSDVRDGSLDTEIWPAEYFPLNQSPDTFVNMVVRTAQNEETMLPALVAAVHRIDPGLATQNESTMMRTIEESPAAYMHRSSAWLIGGFAALALLLSVVGLYGVVAYSVSQRTREIGVRMALGAQRGSVYGLVMREAGRLTAMGVVVGLLCAVGAATLMRKLLFGTAVWDAGTLGGVAVMLAVSALLASFIPAHRAASVNPVDALRAE